ncbi:redoxin domain-containing protein [Domibacillus epiphyticus]|uniref:Thiol-disulfide oxidoreductase n=1 Tax=Domibacillus epiphyticus TaxID=1714355 RepID=A0A1V2ABA8_9BACI|nr:redoxin domain-containing protein [Domibacillus epiphyticus]OMP68283.1 thiol-disulfide oxidoreductase [Domibacillus epiphyticus]
MNKKWFGVILLALLIGIAGFNLYSDRKDVTSIENIGIAVNNDKTGIEQGEKAPDFTLKTIDGKEVNLSDYEGKKVLINFWATWCPPCKAEMPHMQSFYDGEPENVEILAVNLEEKEAKVSEFVKQYELTFPILLDEEGSVGETYEVYTIPTTYLLNEDGTVNQKIIGPMDEAMMKKLIKD